MNIPLYHVDAFTQQPFAGNPAAVCLLESLISDELMQKIAAEMNLSETAFVQKISDSRYHLRWFSPLVEVDLCGHATLATAFVLFSEKHVSKNAVIEFETRSGILKTAWDAGKISMEFPYEVEHSAEIPTDLEKALGARAIYVGKNRMDYLVELESEIVVRNLQPDLNLLAQIETRGVIVTARSHHAEYDFVSRMFGPRVGISEDPVTGSAHCCLGPYWGKKLDKKTLVGYQCSARGGFVAVSLEPQHVLLSGHAALVFKTELISIA
jgi:PhzF family phenazine biosynthesis protein